MINILISQVIVQLLTLLYLENFYFLIESTETFTTGNNYTQPRSNMALKNMSAPTQKPNCWRPKQKSASQTSHSRMCFLYCFEGELLLPDASYEQKVPIFLLILAAPSGRATPLQRFLPGWGGLGKGAVASNAGVQAPPSVNPALFLTSVL